MARDGHIEPVVLLTKTDLIRPEALERLIGQIRRYVFSPPALTARMPARPVDSDVA